MPPHKEHKKFLFVLLRNSMHCIIVVFIYGFVVSMRLPLLTLDEDKKIWELPINRKFGLSHTGADRWRLYLHRSKHLQAVLLIILSANC